MKRLTIPFMAALFIAAIALSAFLLPVPAHAEVACQGESCSEHEVAAGDTLSKMSRRFGCLNKYWKRSTGELVGNGTIYQGEKLQCCLPTRGPSTLPVPPTQGGITKAACGKMSVIRPGQIVNTYREKWENHWTGPASQPGVIPPKLIQEIYADSYGCWHVVRTIWEEYRWSVLKGVYVKVQKSYNVRVPEEGLQTVWP